MAPALSAAETQRRYRAKRDADPERRARYLQKEKEKWQHDKETGKKKRITDLTEREKRAQRKKWRERKREAKTKKIAMEKSRAAIPSPPDTPNTPASPLPTEYSRQRKMGQRHTRRNKQRLEREIKKLTGLLAKQKAKTEKYRKRWQRSQPKTHHKSPRAKINSILDRTVPLSIRRKLLLHASVVEEIRKKYQNTKKEREKQMLARITMGNIIKRYKLQTLAHKTFGFSHKRTKVQGDITTFHWKARNVRVAAKEKLVAFFLRDDVSRMTTGKKDTVTRKKQKKQKRLLRDTLKNLYRKFLSENADQVSFSFFCKARPFWVVRPTETDRKTCLCKIHENIEFMATTLFKFGLLSTKNLEELADATVCNSDSKTCTYGECSTCSTTAVPTLRPASNNMITFFQWATETSSSDEEKKAIITVKKELTKSEEEVLEEFQERMVKFRRHLFNIRWQYRAYKKLREGLHSHECLIHVDFSENYSCKYANEVQSVHFGGSHQQATLHTGVLYTAMQKAPIPFCTISPSRRHDPPAIWTHLDPVLDMITERYPQVNRLHFFSDGPATQYRQKGNFSLLSSEPFKRGFDVTWNFFEANHGKGAPDGVGGTLKRSTDRLVCMGEDIPNAERLFLKLKQQESVVELFFISEDSVEAKVNEMLQVPPLIAVRGTMRIHQVISTCKGKIHYRDITCFCQREEGLLNCPCFDLKEAILQPDEEPHKKRATTAWRPELITSDHVGRWCVVEYDHDYYPGIITKVEDGNIEVNCLHKKGINKYYWPHPREDITWYDDSQVLCLTEEPNALKRYLQLDPATWRLIEERM